MGRSKTFDKQEVLGRAAELFWKQGYHATSMQDLVDHTGINRSSIYDTFGDKHALFEQSLKMYGASNIEGLTGFLDSFPSVRKGTETLVHQMIDRAAADPDRKGCMVVNCTTELAPSDPAVRSALKLNRKEFEGLFAGYFMKGQKSGELDSTKDPAVLAAYLFTVYSGLNVIAKIQASAEEMHAIADQALASIFAVN